MTGVNREDLLDLRVARHRLAEIDRHPDRLVGGAQLAAALDALLERVGHQRCSLILPGTVRSPGVRKLGRKWREQTHGCWCSAWRLLRDGSWRVWRGGRWTTPEPGELRVRYPRRSR